MESIGKGIATVGIWFGVAGLAYAFGKFGVLNRWGAMMMVVAACFATVGIWNDP